MIPHYGRVAVDSTIYVPFHTFDSNDPSASVTLTGLAVTDIEIYKNGSVTQRSSDAGYTLLDTDGIDFGGITGLHGFSIDLSDNTDAGFYASGSFYMVAVSSVTVDAATVNFWACTFFIGGDGAALLTDTEAIVTDTEAILADSEAVLTDSEAILADTEASQTAETAILADTEAAITSRATILVDTEAVLADTEASQTAETSILADTEASQTSEATIITDTEAILADTEGLNGLTPLATGTAQSGTASTIVLASAETFADNELNGNIVKITSGTGAGQSRLILSNTNADDTCNVTPNWTTNPSSDSVYEIVEGAANLVAVGLTAQTAGDIVADTEAVLVDSEAIISDTEAVLTDSEAVLADTEASQTSEASILADTEASQTAETAILADTEASQTAETAILADTEAAITSRATILTDTEAVLTDSEAILADTTALNDTARGEPGQGTPGASVSLPTKIDYLYKAWRNRSTQTATTYSLYADDATTVDQKATVSDDGTTADKGEVATGP